MKRNGLLAVLATLLASLIVMIAGGSFTAKAAGPVDASAGVSLVSLAEQGLLQLPGRTIVNPAGYLETDFSSAGFKTIVTAPSNTTLEVGVSSNVSRNYTIVLDESEYTFFTNKNGNVTLSRPLPAGTHTIQVMQASNITSGSTDYVRMNTIKFAGTVDAAAPEKNVYLEIIGDSMAGGSHALATYAPGYTGSSPDHQVTEGWAWVAAQLLNADVSIVAQGGIGLDGSDMQEAQTGQTNMQSLYDYSSYMHMRNGEMYDFANARTPDAVIVALGENDGYDTNPEPLSATWTEKAVQFILQIKERNGNVPVVWHLSGPRRKGYYYRGLYDAIHNDPRLTVYDNVYVFYNWFDRNGGAAVNNQVQGHPNSTGYYDGGVRLADYLNTSGILLNKAPVPEVAEIVRYVDGETGDDTNDGTSDLTPFKTFDRAFQDLPVSAASNAEFVIYLNGSSSTSFVSGLLFGITEPVRRLDGTLLPIRIESAGDERATIDVSIRTARFASLQPLTLKNIQINNIYARASGTDFFANGSLTVLDNVTYSSSGGNLSLYADVCDSNAFDVMGEGGTSEFILKNGSYDDGTGFGTIAAYGNAVPVQNGRPYVAKMTIAENAIVKDITIINAIRVNNASEIILEVAPLGTIVPLGSFVGTQNNVALNTNVTMKVTGGSIYGGFAMLGNNVSLNGTSRFEMTGGGIYTVGATEEVKSSIVLGGSFDTATVTAVENRITGGVLYIAAAASTPSSIYFAGRDNQTIANVHNYVKHAAIMVMNAAGVSTSAIASEVDIVFGMRSGAVTGSLMNDVVSGFFLTGDIKRSVYFGARTADSAIRSITNTIGFDNPGELNGGPLCWTTALYLGSASGQIGVGGLTEVSASQAAVSETVLQNTIYGGQFYTGIYSAPTHDTSDGTAVFGGIETTVEGGAFRNITAGINYKIAFGANGATVFGHVKTFVNDGFFMTYYLTDGSGSIKDGVEVELNGGFDYTQATSSSYTVYALAGNTITAETEGRAAYSLKVTGGTYHGSFVVGTSASNVTGDKEISVTGGYFNSIQAQSDTHFLSGGYYLMSPLQTLVVEGKVPLKGTYYNAVYTTDTAAYKYCLDDEANGVLINVGYETDGGSGVPSLVGGGYYASGSEYFLTAQSMRGYSFDGWYVNGTKLTSAASYSGTATSPVDYVAKYKWNGGVILRVYGDAFTVASGDETVSKTDYYVVDSTIGRSVTVTYTGAHTFVEWVDDAGSTLSSASSYTFTMNGDTTVRVKTDSGIANTHKHCICGVEHTSIGDHTGDSATTWTALSSYRQLMDLRNSGATTFYLYLTDDIRIEKVAGYSPSNDATGYGNRFLPLAGQTYNICLNGHTISGGSMRLFAFGAPSNVKLVLTDCTGTGEIHASTYGKEDPDLSYAYKVFQGSGTSTLELYGGVTITGANSMNGLPGAAIYSGGTVRIYNAIIENNVNRKAGGAAIGLAGAGAKGYFYGGTIQHNYVDSADGTGGAVSIRSKAQFTLAGGTIDDCYAAVGKGGAIYVADSGSALTITDGVIRNCYTLGTNNGADGGAVYLASGTTLTMSGGLVEDCYAADSRGGAIALSGATATLSGGELKDNRAVLKYAGNLFVEASSKVTISGTAKLTGGYGKTGGGSVGIIGASVVTMTGGTISGGESGASGGNVFISNPNSELKMTGGTVSGGTSGTLGGNVALFNAGTKLTMSGNAKILDGTSGTWGGNVASQAASTVAMSGNAEIANGHATTNTGNVALSGAGTMTMTDYASVHSGAAGYFGATSNNGWANVALHGAGTFKMSGHASIYDGTSKTSCGNLYLGAGSKSEISEYAKIYDGHASSWGGNIGMTSSTASTLTITGSVEIYGGTANYGGNLYMVNSTASITGAKIYDGKVGTAGSKADSFGGNICINGASTVTLTDVEIYGGETLGTSTNNSGSGNSYGGNIVSKGTLTIQGNSKITGGKTTGYAGSIAVNGGTTTVKGNTIISGGQSGTNGGNITIAGGTLNMEAGTIRGGKATNMGGNISLNTGRLNLSGGRILEGIAPTTGGNIMFFGGTLSVTGGTVKDGAAGTAGPDVAIGSTNASITGGYIGSVIRTAGSASGFISGGYYLEEPAAEYIASGKTVLLGIFMNTDATDDTEYLFTIDDPANGVNVMTDSEFIGATGYAASMTGEGLYKSGATFRLTTDDVAGFTFDGWYLNGTKVCEERVFEGSTSTDATYVAVFRLGDDYVILSVRADAFTYAIGDSDAVAAANSIDLPVEKHSNVTLLYTGTDTLEAWTNSSSKVLTTEAEYTFPIYISTLVQASTVNADDGVPVIFMTEYDQIYTVAHVKNGVITEGMPATPYRLGATASWDKTEEEIVTEAASSDSILVTLTKTFRSDVYTVVVTDSASGDELFASEQLVGKNCRISLPEENFMYVKLGDAIISYMSEFVYRGTGAAAMTAYYGTDEVEAESLVTMTVAEGSAGSLTFTAIRAIIYTDDIAEQGILYATTNVDEADFTVGGTGVRKAISNQMDRCNVTTLNINTSSPRTVYARGYVILTDGTILYSRIVSATSN